jgi:hypothetical protein
MVAPSVTDVWFMSPAVNRRMMQFGIGLNLAGLVVLALIVVLNRPGGSKVAVSPVAPDLIAETNAPLPVQVVPKPPSPSAEPSLLVKPLEKPLEPPSVTPPEQPAPAKPPVPSVVAIPVQPPTLAPTTPPPASAVKTDTGRTAAAQSTIAQSTTTQSTTTQTAPVRSGNASDAKPKAPTTRVRPAPPAPSVQPQPTQPNATIAAPVPRVTPTLPPRTKSDSPHNQDDQGATVTGLHPQNLASADIWSQTCALVVDARTLEPRMRPSPSPTIQGPNGEPVWPPAQLQRDAARFENDGIALFASTTDEALGLLGPSRRAVTVEAIISAADNPGASDTDSVFVSAEDASLIRSLDPHCRVVFVR